VDLRTSTLLIGKKRYQLSGQNDGEGEVTRHQWHQRQEASETGLANPTETSSLGQAEMPLSGSNSRGMTNDCWDVVALESVILPPHAEGLVIGRLKGYKGEKLPGEVLVEPHELGTPGAYVARVVSRVLSLTELRELRGQREDCHDNEVREKGIPVNWRKIDRVKTDRLDGNIRYCTLKVLNTRGQHLQMGKNVPLGQDEPLRWTPPKGAGIDFRRTGSRDMAAQRISSLTGWNSRELREERDQLGGEVNTQRRNNCY
jgi:hypothetical protein